MYQSFSTLCDWSRGASHLLTRKFQDIIFFLGAVLEKRSSFALAIFLFGILFFFVCFFWGGGSFTYHRVMRNYCRWCFGSFRKGLVSKRIFKIISFGRGNNWEEIVEEESSEESTVTAD